MPPHDRPGAPFTRRRMLAASGSLGFLAACGGGTGDGPPGTGTRRATVLRNGLAVSQHAASAAPDGTVVVTGGSRGQGVLSDGIDRIDPDTGAMSRIGRLAGGRALHRATALRQGGVLISGGTVSWGSARLAERVNLLSGGSTPAGELSVARVHHAAVELLDGRVLVTGGWSSGEAVPLGISASGELWDPSTRRFRRLASAMQHGRAGHAMSLLPDGRVLVTGGYTAAARGISAEVFDPRLEAFTALAADWGLRAHHASHLVDGRVWLLGGETALAGDGSPQPLASVLAFDPADDRFVPAAALLVPRAGAASVHTPSGSILLLSGRNADFGHTATVEEYFPGAGPRRAESLNVGCELHTGTLMSDGRILVVGGEAADSGYRSATIRYDP
jgi:hypothetical protein